MIDEIIEKLPKDLQDQISYKTYSPGCIIINQDEDFKDVYWVNKGLLKAFHFTEKGQEFLVAIFSGQDTFGELEYFTKYKNFASIEALTESEIIVIPENVFKTLLHVDHKLYEFITTKLCERLSKISNRTIETNYYSLDYLISKFLLSESKRLNSNSYTINKNEIANYFATNIRSINRILKKYSDRNIILIRNNLISIVSPKKLKRVMNEEQN